MCRRHGALRAPVRRLSTTWGPWQPLSRTPGPRVLALFQSLSLSTARRAAMAEGRPVVELPRRLPAAARPLRCLPQPHSSGR